jgi:hypothetical protein
MKKTKKKVTKKSAPKPNLLVEMMNKKKESQESGGKTKSFGKFERKKGRNENNSNVGPSWGPRKGN